MSELIQLQKKLGYRVLNVDASLLELGSMKIEKVFENMIKTAFKYSDKQKFSQDHLATPKE